ncbi:bile acid:sodium symporter family protein [Pseudoalteromonas sp. N1230-9]|uniref:bile acid:sodium symporter family protein n=1 Tax=Pseudoalteromonas sp. N1230-9 TaxID=2907156 RepID=UPI002B29A454|nr:bile acid:sodium symporter family protein [Pseudoalteromonas sp. N1230-9]
MQIDIMTKIVLPLALFIIMFGMGLGLKKKDFGALFISPKALTIGLSCQLLLLPAVAFLLAISLNLPPELAIGLILVACCPGGVTSNLYTYLFKGDVALSISLTTLATFISPFTLPLILHFAMEQFSVPGHEFQLPIIKTISQMLIITVLPVSLGMLFNHYNSLISLKIEPIIRRFSSIFLVIIVLAIIYKNAEQMLGFFAASGIATFTLNISTLLLGLFFAKLSGLSHKQQMSIAVEVGLQNGTLAILIASSLIKNSVMAIPGATYSILMFITGYVFCTLFNAHENKQAHTLKKLQS